MYCQPVGHAHPSSTVYGETVTMYTLAEEGPATTREWRAHVMVYILIIRTCPHCAQRVRRDTHCSAEAGPSIILQGMSSRARTPLRPL